MTDQPKEPGGDIAPCDVPSSLSALLAQNSPDIEARVEHLRQVLIRMFAKRGCGSASEDMAHDVLLRILTKAKSENVVLTTSLESYAMGFVPYIVNELWREREKQKMEVDAETLDDVSPRRPAAVGRYATVQAACFERCIQGLSSGDRRLVKTYFSETRGGDHAEVRRQLSEILGITALALRLRAHRLKKRVTQCFDACMKSSTVFREAS